MKGRMLISFFKITHTYDTEGLPHADKRTQ